MGRIIEPLVGKSNESSRCPGKRAGAEEKKGRDQIFQVLSIFVPAKRCGGKG
jgi:hypothetical protein